MNGVYASLCTDVTPLLLLSSANMTFNLYTVYIAQLSKLFYLLIFGFSLKRELLS